MAIPSLTLRSVKGSALSFAEADSNFQNLANAVVTVTAGSTSSNVSLNSAITFANTATIGASQSGGTVSLTPITTGTAGTYQGSITTDVYGRVTAGTNGFTANITGNGQYLDNVIFTDYKEKVANIGTITGTLSINGNTAPIQTAAVSGNLSIFANGISNFGTGESVTLILRHTGNTRGITSDLKFINGTKTIGGTTNVVDAITIFYDGTDYLAATVKYQA